MKYSIIKTVKSFTIVMKHMPKSFMAHKILLHLPLWVERFCCISVHTPKRDVVWFYSLALHVDHCSKLDWSDKNRV